MKYIKKQEVVYAWQFHKEKPSGLDIRPSWVWKLCKSGPFIVPMIIVTHDTDQSVDLGEYVVVAENDKIFKMTQAEFESQYVVIDGKLKLIPPENPDKPSLDASENAQ